MLTLAIIQARLTSRRFPRKVLEKINGKSMIARVCEASRNAKLVDKTIVAWAHKYPELDENDVLERYKAVVTKYKPDLVVRLTSDCPLLTSEHIDQAIAAFKLSNDDYYSNHLDGYDVQVFYPYYLYSYFSHKEHVINDFTTVSTGLSVNTKEELEKVRELCKGK